jgi:DNA-binding protein HU-beta
MTKSELIGQVASRTGFTRKDSSAAVEAVLGLIAEALAAGEKVSLVGFGVFTVRDRAGRIGRNPRTAKPMTITARRIPVFKAGKALKEQVASND